MATKSEEKKSTLLDWGLFAVSTIVMVYMISQLNPWFWVVLPFSLTYLVKALRAM